jgi:guanylate kinase
VANAPPAGHLFVIAAPSGTGKSTIARRLVQRVPGLEFSVSYTTRPQRAGEVDGRDYHFVDRAGFEAMAARGEFLEWAPVFDQLYGTGREATRRSLAAGHELLLDIDVQGARQVRESGEPNTSVMLLPPDYRTLRARLAGRGSETEQTLATRLAEARREGEEFPWFDYLVVNEDLEETVAHVEAIVRAERLRTRRRTERARAILDTFPG